MTFAPKEDQDAEKTCRAFQVFASIHRHYIITISFPEKGRVMNFLQPPQIKNHYLYGFSVTPDLFSVSCSNITSSGEVGFPVQSPMNSGVQ